MDNTEYLHLLLCPLCVVPYLKVTAAAVGSISIQVVVVRHLLTVMLHGCGNATLKCINHTDSSTYMTCQRLGSWMTLRT